MKFAAASAEVKDGVAIGVIGLTVLLFFVSVWLVKGPYFVHDIVTVMAPLEELFGRIQRAGESPLWAPEIHGGYPLLAFGQLGYFYPLHIVLRQFLSGVWVVNSSLAIHVLLGALGMFGLLRSQRLSAEAGVLGGLVYGFGGAVTARFAHIAMVLPLAWLPWSVLALDQAIRSRTHARGWVVVWIGANVGQVMAGHPQSALMGLCVQVVWVLALIVRRQVSVRLLVQLLGASLLISGFLLPHLLPVLDTVPATDRAQGLPQAELFEFSAPPSALLGLVVPHPYGRGDQYAGPKGEAELALYVGPVALLLAAVAAGVMWRRRLLPVPVAAAGLLIGVGLALGLGENSVVYRLMALYTPQNFFSVPVRYFLLVHVGVVVLAALGLDHLPSRWRRLVLLLATVPVVVVAWGWEEKLPSWAAADQPAIVEQLRALPAPLRIWAQERLGDFAPADNFGIAVGDTVDTSREYRQTLAAPFAALAGVELRLATGTDATAGQLRVIVEENSGEVLREGTLKAADILDSEWTRVTFPVLAVPPGTPLTVRLVSTWPRETAPRLFIHGNPAGLNFNPTGSLSVCRQEVCAPVAVGDAVADGALRLVGVEEAGVLAHEVLLPHIAAGFGIPSGQWTGALPITWVNQYLAAVPENRVLFDRLGITHWVGWTPPYWVPPAGVGWQELEATPRLSGFVHVLQNKQVWPRFQFAGDVQAVPLAEQQAALLSLAPNSTVIVSAVSADARYTPGGDIHVVQDERTRLTLRTARTSPGFLVVRDLLYPGWTATIDGQATPLLATDVLWRGLVVPAGNHEIIFHYWPRWVMPAVWGVSLALVGLVCLVGRLVWDVRFRQQRMQRGETIPN